MLFTNDGGDSWQTRHFGVDTILLASFSDPTHGLLRTAPTLFFLDGSDALQQIAQPAETLQRFRFTPFLVALSPDKMVAVLSEGPYSEGGFLSTTDGGKHWSFYDPPSTGIKDLLRIDGNTGLRATRLSERTSPAADMVCRWLSTPKMECIGLIPQITFNPATGRIVEYAMRRAALRPEPCS